METGAKHLQLMQATDCKNAFEAQLLEGNCDTLCIMFSLHVFFSELSCPLAHPAVADARANAVLLWALVLVSAQALAAARAVVPH